MSKADIVMQKYAGILNAVDAVGDVARLWKNKQTMQAPVQAVTKTAAGWENALDLGTVAMGHAGSVFMGTSGASTIVKSALPLAKAHAGNAWNRTKNILTDMSKVINK